MGLKPFYIGNMTKKVHKPMYRIDHNYAYQFLAQFFDLKKFEGPNRESVPILSSN